MKESRVFELNGTDVQTVAENVMTFLRGEKKMEVQGAALPNGYLIQAAQADTLRTLSGMKLAKAKVTAQIVEQFKGEKQLVFKFHKRKRYRRLKGHRQQLTKLKIVKVQATSRAKKAVKAEAEAVAEAPVAE